jgi:hypothetical protein
LPGLRFFLRYSFNEIFVVILVVIFRFISWLIS